MVAASPAQPPMTPQQSVQVPQQPIKSPMPPQKSPAVQTPQMSTPFSPPNQSTPMIQTPQTSSQQIGKIPTTPQQPMTPQQGNSIQPNSSQVMPSPGQPPPVTSPLQGMNAVKSEHMVFLDHVRQLTEDKQDLFYNLFECTRTSKHKEDRFEKFVQLFSSSIANSSATAPNLISFLIDQFRQNSDIFQFFKEPVLPAVFNRKKRVKPVFKMLALLQGPFVLTIPQKVRKDGNSQIIGQLYCPTETVNPNSILVDNFEVKPSFFGESNPYYILSNSVRNITHLNIQININPPPLLTFFIVQYVTRTSDYDMVKSILSASNQEITIYPEHAQYVQCSTPQCNGCSFDLSSILEILANTGSANCPHCGAPVLLKELKLSLPNPPPMANQIPMQSSLNSIPPSGQISSITSQTSLQTMQQQINTPIQAPMKSIQQPMQNAMQQSIQTPLQQSMSQTPQMPTPQLQMQMQQTMHQQMQPQMGMQQMSSSQPVPSPLQSSQPTQIQTSHQLQISPSNKQTQPQTPTQHQLPKSQPESESLQANSALSHPRPPSITKVNPPPPQPIEEDEETKEARTHLIDQYSNLLKPQSKGFLSSALFDSKGIDSVEHDPVKFDAEDDFINFFSIDDF